MAKKKVTKKNFDKVVDNFATYLKQTFKEGDKDFQINWLNDLLDDLASEDAFGTEGQNDPRGDNRN